MNPPNDGSTLSKSRTSSSTVASASVRPRTKRYITGFEDLSDDVQSSANHTNDSTAAASPSASYLESPFFPRVPSPIPSKHPSRSSSLRPTASRNAAVAANGSFPSPSADLTASITDLWGKSWTHLQAVASNVLGNDPTGPIKDNPNRPRKSHSVASSRRSTGPKQWGPKEQSQPGAGSKEERKALVRAKKREELLLQAGRTDGFPINAAVQYKRRTSDDFESSTSMPPGELDNRDALVYIHNVTPADTLAGISIKFNCPMASIKKANGMWSNDGLQARKTLILPVDSCNVKGRRVGAPDQQPGDLLSDSTSTDNVATPTQASIREWEANNRRGSTATLKPKLNSEQPNPSNEIKQPEDTPWSHESWMLIEGHLSPIEIARLPRVNLGFFPRARRRSNAQSEADVPSHSNSLDQPRPSMTPSDNSSALGANQSFHRPRRSSSSQDFANRMVGPGGVGTLKGKGPSAPGPAEDKLSKVFENFPALVTPRRLSLDEPESQQSSRPSSPGYSYSGNGLDSIGLAVEGFVRKLAKNASKVIQEHTSTTPVSHHYDPQRQSSRSRRVKVSTGMASSSATSLGGAGTRARLGTTTSGDLIELENAFEIGDDDDDEHEAVDFPERGRSRSSGAPTPTNGRVAGDNVLR